MKTLLTFSILLFSMVVLGQKKPVITKAKTRYFVCEFSIELSNGCLVKGAWYPTTSGGYAITFDDCKYSAIKWVVPNKIDTFIITSLQELDKPNKNFTRKGEAFKCVTPAVYHNILILKEDNIKINHPL